MSAAPTARRPPRLPNLVAALVAVFVCAAPAHAAIELRASVDRNQVAVGERLILSIEATGSQNVPAPSLSDVPGFQVQYAGPSTQVSFVNGHMSSSVSHRYALFAQQQGKFTLGPFGVDFDGQHYEAPAITVNVTAQTQRGAAKGAAGTGNIDVRLTLGDVKDAPFVGERIPLLLTLYVGNARIDDLHYPEFAAEGFVLDKWTEPTQSDEVVNGRRYRAVRFQTTLTPLRAGPLSLTPTMEMALLRSRRRGDPFFDNFFGDAFAEREPFRAQADPVTLDVQPLPDVGKPASFTGAVGQFDFTLDARPAEVNVGDPITVRMEIKGTGNFDQVNAPAVPPDDRFRRYDPVADKDAQEAGRRAYEQVLIPKTDQVKQVPAVQFSFFDPAAGAYRTITRGPIPVTVRAAAGGEAKVVAAPALSEPAQRPAEQLGRDIVYIKDVPDGFWPRRSAWFGRWWFILLLLVPLVAFAIAAAFARRRDRDAADPRLVRFRHAGRAARGALETVRQQAQTDGFYDALAAAVSQFLTAKLDLPPGAVERERVIERLGRNGAAPQLADRITALFALIERARYAPSAAAPAEREEALRLAQQLIDELDRDRTLATRFAPLGVACLGIILSVVAMAQDGQFNPQAVFFEGNAAYKAGRYADAATAYQSIHDAGFAGGALYFNLGNAQFKSGKIGAAVLGYERALRVRPRDADVRANLAYAREQAKDEEVDTPLWRRALLPLADRATSGELAVVVGLLWWLLWLALIVRVVFPRFAIASTRSASMLGLLLVVIGASFAARLVEVDLVRAGVVTASGETAVRFEPTPSGTQYFSVNEGVRVDVTEEREDWLQVRRSDGRRGWIPKSAVTEM
jgi:tetratricopeptide (TPR) repeat protein